MRVRSFLPVLLLTGLVLPFVACTISPDLTSIVVTPSVMNFGGPGLTTQLTATGYYARKDHPPEVKDITTQVTWKSATPDCVTVSSTGLITSGRNICSGILVTASMPGFYGLITGSMIVNVTQPGAANTNVATVVVSPANPAPLAVGQVLQFSATGYTASGSIANLANPVAWSSSNTGVATINQTGRATAVAAGSTTITAAYTNADGTSAIPGTAILSVQ